MLKVAIIGSGFGLYGLLPAFHSTEGCRVVSICGKKSKRLLSYCNAIGLTHVYTDWKTMFEEEDIDAVAIAVTPSAQYEIAKTAIRKGIHVFAEKPFAVNVKQARELHRLATTRGITNAVDYIFPEIDQWQQVKKFLDDQLFGRLTHISSNWDFVSHDIGHKISSWKTDVKEGGGALSFYFSHGLYYLEYYAGTITGVKSSFSYTKDNKIGGETGVDILLKFKNGVKGYAHINSNAPGQRRHKLMFQCEKGSIVLENEHSIVDNFVIHTYPVDGKGVTLVSNREVDENNEDGRVKIVRHLTKRFVDSCMHNKQMTPSFADGVRVQKLIEMIRKNHIA